MLKMGPIRKAECMWLIGKRGGCSYTKKAKVRSADSCSMDGRTRSCHYSISEQPTPHRMDCVLSALLPVPTVLCHAQVVEGVGGCGMIIVNNEHTVSRMPYKEDEEVRQIQFATSCRCFHC